MSQSLIVHIGTPKTGSSSLQRALHDRAYTTNRVRVAYPDRLSEVDLAQALARDRKKAVARRMGNIERWLATADADVFALSSEHFVRVRPSAFEAAMRRHLPGWPPRTQVVCYVRPHGPRLVSAFAQLRKTGSFLGSMDEFIHVFERKKRLHYANRLATWHKVYGDKFVVRHASSSTLVGGDVVTDFLSLATSGDGVQVHARRLNTSLSVEALTLVQIVHRAMRNADVPAAVAHRIGKRIAADLNTAGVADQGHRLWLSQSQAQSIAELFNEDAARLDATFFPDSMPLSEGLERLTDEAPVEAPDMHPRNYADRDTRRSIRTKAAQLADVCLEHGEPWVVRYRAVKGYRHSEADLRPDSVAHVEAALEPVVSSLASALRALP